MNDIKKWTKMSNGKPVNNFTIFTSESSPNFLIMGITIKDTCENAQINKV